ncbi:MAG: hypothetical protein LZ166_03075 [Thaumarchaeota archaeon]|jgi:hypothetical protein|nr:hypothetical protein [Candidatus Wolframiiraptor allenii]
MRLYPLHPLSKTAANISKLSRKLKINVITMESIPITGIIVLADGTPDDYVISILSHKLDGKYVAGIAKPEKTRIGVFSILPVYIRYHVKKLLIVIDQEDEALNSLFQEIRAKISEIARIINAREETRLAIYTCERQESRIQIIVSINGLDEYDFEKHTIEDHLLKAAEISLKIKLEGSDPKKCWKNLREEHKYEIFGRLLKESNEHLEQIFPQQIQGLRYLISGFEG